MIIFSESMRSWHRPVPFRSLDLDMLSYAPRQHIFDLNGRGHARFASAGQINLSLCVLMARHPLAKTLLLFINEHGNTVCCISSPFQYQVAESQSW